MELRDGIMVLLLCHGDTVIGSIMTLGLQGHGVLGLGKESKARGGRAVAVAMGSG